MSVRSWIHLVVLAVLCGTAMPALAQAPAEERLAFDAAARAWEDGDFQRVRREFGEFVARFPASTLRKQAEERVALAAAELALSTNSIGAARSLFQAFLREHAGSALAPNAAVGYAATSLRAGEPRAAIAELQSETSPFARVWKAGEARELRLRGMLVLAEAQLAVGDFSGVEASLERGRPLAVQPVDGWRRLFLLVEGRRKAGAIRQALDAARELRVLTTNEVLAARRPAANAILAGLLSTNALDESLKLWDENLGVGLAPGVRREAVLRGAETLAAAGRALQAQERLATWLNANKADAEADGIRVSLGQLLLRTHFSVTNDPARVFAADQLALLSQAAGLFDQVLTNRAATPSLQGPAWLGRGWCRWREYEAGIQPSNRLAEARAAFARAAEILPWPGYEAAVATHKLGECLWIEGQWRPALDRFITILSNQPSATAAAELTGPALQLGSRCAVELRDGPLTLRLVDGLRGRMEPQAFADHVQWLSVRLADLRRPAEARDLLARQIASAQDDAVRAPLELALASLHFRAADWTNAIATYDRWLARYPRLEAAPAAEFERAMAAERAGLTTNSVVLFATLAAHYPTNQLGLKAGLWLASHYYNSQDYVRSELACVNILTNAAWAGSADWHRARLLASRAALGQRSAAGLGNARGYLTNLVNDTHCPTALLPEAFLVFGDMFQREFPEGSTNVWENFRDAIAAYSRVIQLAPASEWAAQAHIAAGYSHLQLAVQTSASYGAAYDQFQSALDHPAADATIRSAAKWGLGQVKRKLQRPEEAFDHYADVLYGKVLKPGEQQNDYWVRKTGVEAAQLLEQQGRWDQAARVYDRLASLFPALKLVFDQSARRARSLAPP